MIMSRDKFWYGTGLKRRNLLIRHGQKYFLMPTMKGLDTVESLSAGALVSIFLLLKVLSKLGLLYDVDKSSTIPTLRSLSNKQLASLDYMQLSV